MFYGTLLTSRASLLVAVETTVIPGLFILSKSREPGIYIDHSNLLSQGAIATMVTFGGR